MSHDAQHADTQVEAREWTLIVRGTAEIPASWFREALGPEIKEFHDDVTVREVLPGEITLNAAEAEDIRQYLFALKRDFMPKEHYIDRIIEHLTHRVSEGTSDGVR